DTPRLGLASTSIQAANLDDQHRLPGPDRDGDRADRAAPEGGGTRGTHASHGRAATGRGRGASPAGSGCDRAVSPADAKVMRQGTHGNKRVDRRETKIARLTFGSVALGES